MTRRGLFRLFSMVFAVPEEHVHSFDKSPFYLHVAVTREEPAFYPPAGMYPVEICKCGAFRIRPENAKQYFGKEHMQ